MKKGISGTLWARVTVDGKDEFRVVARMSAELGPTQRNLLPCDGEVTAHYVAAKCPYFATHIKASSCRTLTLADNKAVVEAAKLLQTGKFSASKIVNELLTSTSDLNLDIHHISGNMSKNCPDDFASRKPALCTDPVNCRLHSFIRECSSSVSSSVCSIWASPSSIIGAVDAGHAAGLAQDLISGKARLPFENRKAMAFLQDKDKNLARVKSLLSAGQVPSKKKRQGWSQVPLSIRPLSLNRQG